MPAVFYFCLIFSKKALTKVSERSILICVGEQRSLNCCSFSGRGGILMPRDKTKSHERIIEAAKKEFLEYGYTDASLRRIAANAGIQVGGLYKHFESKDEMFESLVEPAKKGFYELYHDLENEYFDETLTADASHEVETRNESVRTMGFIYSHYDEFRLLILRSQGTRYEDFKHEIAMLEEKVTMRYLDELVKRG